ncbi:MAG: ATP-binding protein, partial [Bacteroidetes bacterium]
MVRWIEPDRKADNTSIMIRYPFKFLSAYNSEDTDIFFGRDEEVEQLYQMVFQSDLLLVYGGSGTGKSSLISCGLASRFEPHDWLALTIRRGRNINESLRSKLASMVKQEVPAGMDLSWLDETEEAEAGSELSQQIQTLYRQYFRPIYLIFDQFEELYILGSAEEQARFIDTVKEILGMEQPVKLIIIIREEYLGHLFEFERAVPQLMRKKLRVEPMNLDKVRQVIVGATSHEHSNIRLRQGEEEAVVEGIFTKVKGEGKQLTIQLPYLQVFLDKLYMQITGDEQRQAEAVFNTKALEEIGDMGDVLRDFLQEQALRIQQQLTA